jgi:hypothetical protein
MSAPLQSVLAGLAGLARLAPLALLLGGAACDSKHEPPGQAPTNPRSLTQAPVPVAPPPAPPPPPPAPARPSVALMYSSDLRGRVSPKEIPRQLPPGVTLTPLALRESTGGLARRATVVDHARVEAAFVVQVDAGDFLPLATDPPDPAATGPKALDRRIDLVLAAYRRMGVDAVTLGERELAGAAGDPRKLAARAKAGHLRIVLANLTDRKGAGVFPADVLVDAAGLSVGILGVTELPESAAAALAKAGYTLGDAREAARAAARGLRQRGAKLVVALVHAAGPSRAAAIAEGIAEIDVVVANQETEAGAAPPPSPAPAKPRVVSTGGESVGRLDVRVAAGGVPAFEDRVFTPGKDVRLQLGVDLLTRVQTIPLIDSKVMEASIARGSTKYKMRDLYESWEFGSTKACNFCHKAQVAQWETTGHATALKTLQRAKREKDPACLGCHVMGFLQPGGTRDIVMALGGFANVGCESCHGPSAEHVRSVDKKLGTSRAVDPAICWGCHTPDQNLGDFDPVAAIKEGDILGPGHGKPATPDGGVTSATPDAQWPPHGRN